MEFGEEVNALTAVKKGRYAKNTPRKMPIYIARKYGDYRLQELADMFGLQYYDGISYAVHAFAQVLRKDLEARVCSVVTKFGVVM